MKKLVRIVALLVGTGLIMFAATPAADARGFLPKWEARAEVLDGVESMYLDMDDATDYWVERSRGCERWSRMKVVCDYSMEFDYGDVVCDSTFGVKLYRWGGTDVFFPSEPDCY